MTVSQATVESTARPYITREAFTLNPPSDLTDIGSRNTLRSTVDRWIRAGHPEEAARAIEDTFHITGARQCISPHHTLNYIGAPTHALRQKVPMHRLGEQVVKFYGDTVDTHTNIEKNIEEDEAVYGEYGVHLQGLQEEYCQTTDTEKRRILSGHISECVLAALIARRTTMVMQAIGEGLSEELDIIDDDLLVAVPASQRHDHGGRTAADLIVYVGLEAEEVPIQMKTNLTDHNRRRYDETKVLMMGLNALVGERYTKVEENLLIGAILRELRLTEDIPTEEQDIKDEKVLAEATTHLIYAIDTFRSERH